MEFKAEDFAKLKFNCYSVPKEESVFDAFPELRRYPDLTTTEHMLPGDKMIRYVIYMYDKYSPLTAEKNIIKRKMLSAQLAGFEMPDGKFTQEVEQMIGGRNIFVNRMVCCYVRNQRDIQYALMMTGLTQFYDNLKQLSKPSEEEGDMEDLNRKSTLFNHTMKMIETLESMAIETFNGDVQLMYEADEVQQEEQKKITSYPEFISNLRESGELEKEFKRIKKEDGI